MKKGMSVSWVLVAIAGCSSGAGTGAAQSQGTPGDAGDAAVAAGDDAAPAGDDAAGSSTAGYEATLSGAEVVPPLVTSSSGTAKFNLESDGMTLTYDITLSVPNATAVDIHLAAAGENAAVTHPLTPISGHMTGSVTLTMAEQAALTSDMLYVDVQTQANPSGEVRGQIMPSGATLYVANTTPGQELPSTTSTSTGHGSFVLSADGATVIYHVVTTATPTDVRLERAIAGLVGPVADDLAPASQTMDGTLQIGAGDPADLAAGHLYLNIVTAAYLGGELRGQIMKPGEALFSGVLSGAAESPSTMSTASGGAQFILSAAQDSVRYEVDVSGTIPTAAEIDHAAAKQNGPQLYPLTLAAAGAQGMTGCDVRRRRCIQEWRRVRQRQDG